MFFSVVDRALISSQVSEEDINGLNPIIREGCVIHEFLLPLNVFSLFPQSGQCEDW